MRFLLVLLAGLAVAAEGGAAGMAKGPESFVDLEHFGALEIDTASSTAHLSGGVRAAFGGGWIEATDMTVRLEGDEHRLVVDAKGGVSALLPVRPQAAEGGAGEARLISIERADGLFLDWDGRRLKLDGDVAVKEGESEVIGEAVDISWTPEGDYVISVKGGEGARARLRTSDLAGLREGR